MTSAPLLALEGISKRYGGVQALDAADFSCRAGRIHALLGENGAGKSTLIKIMAGVAQPDAGRMVFDGRERRFAHPQDAVEAGIACIFQELSLLPDLSVADNICITRPPRRLGLIDRTAQRRIAEAALQRAGASEIHPQSPVRDLPLSRRQLVEIAKALSREPKLLILDEATSALTAADVERVFELLQRLRAEGLAIVYISHRMKEIAALADDCSIFRNGRHVASFVAGTHSDAQIVEMMIGRDVAHVFPTKPAKTGRVNDAPAIAVRGLRWEERLRGIDFEAHVGEVVGLGGLDGQGQREFLLALFGTLAGVQGETSIHGKPGLPRGPQEAKSGRFGIAFTPEDRKTEGLMLPMSVRSNLSFAALQRLFRFGLIVDAVEQAACAEQIRQLAIKAPDLAEPVATLSGGNQQKVVVGKWLMTVPRIVLLCDPTRGIDVGTKQEMYVLLRQVADQGACVVLYSTDHAELTGCCDRVAVFREGRIVAWLQGDALDERALVASALGVSVDEALA